MRIAVISDIHSNYEPLKKIVNHIKEQDVDLIINLGDIVSKGNEHKECIEYLMHSDITSVKGNSELYLLNGVDIDPDVIDQRKDFENIYSVLEEDHINYLRDLPMELELKVKGKKLYFSHFMLENKEASYPYYTLASVRDGSFFKDLKEFRKDYDLLVFGHAHIKIIMDNAIIIPSVGLSELEYLIITIEENIEYEFIKVNE